MIEIKNLSHIYKTRKKYAISNINMKIRKGEKVIIIGQSGSGKSTFLSCLNRLIEPTSGEIRIDGKEILNCDIKEAERIRGGTSIIFQNFNLIERSTVFDNVLNGRLKFNNSLKTLFNKFSEEDLRIVRKNIERVGLKEFTYERVSNLSGGQKQRVAIARAISQEPKLILADEPVSSLDPKLMKDIMDLLINLCDEEKITLIANLHFLDLVKSYATRIIGMKDGKIIFDGNPKELSEQDITNIYGKGNVVYANGNK